MESWTTVLTAALVETFETFGRPNQRIFWPYLLTSLAIATAVWFVHVRRKRSWLAYMFPLSVWAHPSARLDYLVIGVRAVLRVLTAAWVLTSSLAVAVWVSMHLRHAFGAWGTVRLPFGLVPVAFTLALFVADDFTRFALHLASHRVPSLWELHKVHHSAEVLTPFTLNRVHPIEGWLNALRATLTIGCVTGAFFWACGPRLRAVDVFGVEVFGMFWTALGANLRHSQVWWSFGPRLERFFISPAQHQIHHSREPRHFDRNFGSALAIWDWACGTLYVTSRREKLRFGLADGEWPHGHRLLPTLVFPIVRGVRALADLGRGWGRPESSRPPIPAAHREG